MAPLDPPPITRQLSTLSVVAALLQQGPISRARIAKLTGLSKQTASEVMRFLEERGWVRERGTIQGSVGRTAITYEIRPDAAFVVGIDLGGTKLRIAVADLACRVVAETVVTTDRRGGRHLVRQIGSVARVLLAKNGLAAGKVRLAVLGTPGVADRKTGRIHFAPNIRGLDAIDVAGLLRAELGIEVHIENDVNLAVIGERWQGCGQKAANLAFIALGSGIGMGLMIDGRLVRGAHGAAGEISYLPLGPDPFAAASRSRGSLERAVSAAGIVADYLARRGGADEPPSVRELFSRAEQGDADAAATLDAAARMTALAILSVATIVDPELVVLGGSIGARPELVTRVRAKLVQCMEQPIPLEASVLGDRAIIVGAVAVGLNEVHNALFGMRGIASELSLPSATTLCSAEAAE